ncbi:MAG: hypothetical protein QM778_39240 [Myxococcales bacterium]
MPTNAGSKRSISRRIRATPWRSSVCQVPAAAMKSAAASVSPASSACCTASGRASIAAKPCAARRRNAQCRAGFGAFELLLQILGEQRVVAEPFALAVQRHQQAVEILQPREQGGAVAVLAHVVGQRGVEAFEHAGVEQEFAQFRGQAHDHLFGQVRRQLRAAPAEAGQVGFGLALDVAAGPQRRKVQGDRPAFGALAQRARQLRRCIGAEQRGGFGFVQRQFRRAETRELAVRGQARQRQVRVLARGDQQMQVRPGMLGQAQQQGVAGGAVGAVVVVENQHQPLRTGAQGLHQRAGRGVRIAMLPMLDQGLQRRHRLRAGARQGDAEIRGEAARIAIVLVQRQPCDAEIFGGVASRRCRHCASSVVLPKPGGASSRLIGNATAPSSLSSSASRGTARGRCGGGSSLLSSIHSATRSVPRLRSSAWGEHGD